VAPDGLIASSPGFNVNEQNNAMAAWQNTIVPPDPDIKVDKVALDLGRDTFKKAGCISCHAGAAGTNNRIISVKKIGTEPSRAKSFKKTQKIFGESVIYSPDTPVPVPKDAKVLNVPIGHLDTDQIAEKME
jgi:cytochrome c peroxidase